MTNINPTPALATRGDFALRDVEITGHGRADIRVAGGRIAEIGRSIDLRDLPALWGGTVLPGLHDHHTHLLALAAARRSLDCGSPHVSDPSSFAATLQHAPGSGWIRGVGYDDQVVGSVDRHALDAIVDTRPVRIQHRSGSLWVLNSAAIDLLDVDRLHAVGVERDVRGRPTGRLWRLDRWLHDALGTRDVPDLTDVGRLLARLGITGVTDATPGPTAALADAAQTMPQRVLTLGDDSGCRQLGLGPVKIVLSDHALPALDDLKARIAIAHESGRGVAVHSVTRESLFLVLAALEGAGRRCDNRVEHAADVPPEAIELLAARGVTVVTQPSFIWRRGDDYLARVDERDRADLWRHRSLLDAGIPVAMSSDAPYGDPDPWRSIRAAVQRETATGQLLGADERVTPDAALDGFLTSSDALGAPVRTIAVGADADLIVLDCSRTEMLAAPDSSHIRATLIGGAPVYLRDDDGR